MKIHDKYTETKKVTSGQLQCPSIVFTTSLLIVQICFRDSLSNIVKASVPYRNGTTDLLHQNPKPPNRLTELCVSPVR